MVRAPATCVSPMFALIPSSDSILKPPQSDQIEAEIPSRASTSAIL